MPSSETHEKSSSAIDATRASSPGSKQDADDSANNPKSAQKSAGKQIARRKRTSRLHCYIGKTTCSGLATGTAEITDQSGLAVTGLGDSNGEVSDDTQTCRDNRGRAVQDVTTPVTGSGYNSGRTKALGHAN